MPVISVEPDPAALTLTVVCELDAPPERVWRIWEDPAQLQRWWGPPGWPATFTRHDFAVPGTSIYYMSGPAGEQYYGYWHFRRIEPTTLIEIADGFGDAEGNPAPEMPGESSFLVGLVPIDSGTRMTVTSRFATADDMARQLGMGMAEGIRLAAGQIDAILEEG